MDMYRPKLIVTVLLIFAVVFVVYLLRRGLRWLSLSLRVLLLLACAGALLFAARRWPPSAQITPPDSTAFQVQQDALPRR